MLGDSSVLDHFFSLHREQLIMISSLLTLSTLMLGALTQDSSDASVFTKYSIFAPGINASFIPYGATLTNLFVPDKDGNPQDVVLGYDTGTAYLHDTETNHTYFGAVVGRYANRIKNGTFTVQYVYLEPRFLYCIHVSIWKRSENSGLTKH